MENQVKPATLAELQARLEAAEKAHADFCTRIAALETAAKGKKSEREMTDDDARRVINGDLKSKTHNEAAQALHLSYGQVYSARLEYTFRHIHKGLKDAGFKNPWKAAQK